jgi:hypothetical protein
VSALTVQAPTRRLVVDGRSVTVVRGPIVGAGGGVSDHGALTGRDEANSHPLAAVTGLTDSLAGKANVVHEHVAADVTDLDAVVAGQIAAVAPSGPTRTVLAAGPVVANTTAVSSLLASPIVLPTIGTNGEADIDLAFDMRCNVAAASMLLTLVVGGVTVWVSGSSPQQIAQSATGRHAGPIRVRLWRDSASQTTWDVSSMVTLSTTGVSHQLRSSAGVAAIDASGATVDLWVTFNVASALLTAQTVRGVVTVWQP